MTTRNRGYKTRLYLSHPEPDIATIRKSVTRFIPPSPPPPPPCPPIEAPAPPPPPPPAPVCPEPLPPPPPPPREPTPEPDPIDVIAVDVDPSPPKKPKKKKSRSKSRSRSHERDRDYERVVERDHYIPYPVRVEPQYETFRYVEGPRRWSPPKREVEDRRPLMLEDQHQVNIRLRDREHSRERSRDCYHDDRYYDDRRGW